MRVLFIHASRDSTPEYTVHRLLSEHVDPDVVDCFFVWQDSTHDRTKNHSPRLARADRTVFWDFGRNMSLSPRPSRVRRATLVLWRLPSSLWFLWRTIRRIRPDIIYTSQQGYEILLVQVLRPFIRLPHVIHLHYLIGPWMGRWYLRTFRKHPYLLACSNFVRQWGLDAGVPQGNIGVIHNPADVGRFKIHVDRGSVLAEFGWDAQTLVIVSVGRLDPWKGHALLLEAFARVLHAVPQARLLICGQTTMRSRYDLVLHQRAADLGLSRAVAFAGVRSDLPSLFAASDIFCLPTENDPLPLVFLEAMAAGLPAVACRSGGVPEMVIHDVTGLLSQLGEVAGLAGNLLALLRSSELRQEMGEAGRARVLTTFAPPLIAGDWAAWLHTRFPPAVTMPSGRRSL